MSRLLSLPLLGIAHAVNPLASGGAMIGGLADPHAHVWSASADRVHIYATQDELSGNGTCCTGDWWIWSSADLIDWVPESQLPYFPWEPAELQTEFWATDAIERAGRFYWYVSVGGSQVAVATSETPTGPWSDPLGAPLLNKSLGDSLDPPTSIRDPGALADDDGNYYLVFGACSGEQQPDDSCYYLAQLNDDMISVQPPQHLSVKNAMGPYGPGKADDKPFLHKRGDIYYLSWGCFYGVSDDVYGPYEYQGSFISPDLIEPSFRYGNASQVPWYTQGDYADRHGSFLNFHGQSYYLPLRWLVHIRLRRDRFVHVRRHVLRPIVRVLGAVRWMGQAGSRAAPDSLAVMTKLKSSP